MAKILVADDDASNRLLLTTLLRHAGHTVVEAADGESALERVSMERPELALIDLSMPVLSGGELIRRIRADPANAGVALALYTATPPNDAVRDFMQIYRVQAAIPKPCEPDILLRMVEALLSA